MGRDEAAGEPLVGLVARALRTEVRRVSSQRIETSLVAEVDRIRWEGPDGAGRLVFSRVAEAATVEVQLLPFLARRGLPVPRVVARGIPPPHAPERRAWLLTEEVDGEPLCDAIDESLAEAAGGTLLAIQRATAQDEPVLTALGVPALPAARVREEALAASELLDATAAARLRVVADGLDATGLESLGASLAHGALGCASVFVGERSLIVTDWMRAHLGCPLQDLARLCAELRARGVALAEAAARAYGASGPSLRQPELLQHLFDVRWASLLAGAGLVSRELAIARVVGSIERAEALLSDGRSD